MRLFRAIHQALYTSLAAAVCAAPLAGTVAEPESGIGTLDCVINPSVIADLGSSAPGILSEVLVDRSDFVEAGDVIAELESGVEAASVDLARTRADSTAEVDLRRTNAAFGNRLRDRTKDLFKRKVVSNNDLDERETEARLGWIQLRQAQDNQSIARLELVRAEEVLKRRTISSPITGVVMERFKVVGEYIEDQPVARIAQLDPLHVEVIVPVEHLGQVTPGMTAEVWTDVVEGQRWSAQVARVDQVADVASGTYGVRLALPNPDYRIPAGLRCQVQLIGTPQPVTVYGPPTVPPTKANSAESTAARQQPIELDDGGDATAVVVESVQQVPLDDEKAQPEQTGQEVTTQAEVQTVETTAPPVPVQKLPVAPDEGGHADAVAVESADQVPVADEQAQPEETAWQATAKAAEQMAEATPASVVAETPPVEMAQNQTAQPPSPAIPVLSPNKPTQVCRVAGPFRDEIDATRYVVKLRRAGLDVEMKTAAKSTDVEYKVMTPVLGGQAAVDEVLQSLKAADMTDFYVRRLPAGKQRIYLGLFNQEKRAAQRVAALKKAGIKALVRPSKAPGSNFFLVVRGLRGHDTDRLLAALPASPGGEAGELGLCERGEAVSMR